MPEEERVQTGIPGLDEMLGGGLIAGSSALIEGGCGVGKTTLSMQYLVNGANQYDENGVYVSFNETPQVLKKNLEGYGWGLEELEARSAITILRLEPADLIQVIREDYGEIRDVIKENSARRVIIDPISTFSIVVKDEFEQKMSLLKFCEWLRKHDCTTLMISEVDRSPGLINDAGFEPYVVDTVILMYNLQIKNSRQNALEVLKMRGSSHSKKITPFIFEKGISILPDEKLFWSSETYR